MKKWMLCALLFATPASAEGLIATFIGNPDTQNLLALCSSSHPEDKWVDRAYCNGYVWGVYSGADLHPDSVLMGGVSFNTLYDTLRESLAQHPANKLGNRRLQPARHVLIESWVYAGLITFKPKRDAVVIH